MPDLKKNLISLGALESNGFKVSLEIGVFNVTRGALVVIKGLRRNNLYFLQGKTVVGRAATVETTVDMTMFWHMVWSYRRKGHTRPIDARVIVRKLHSQNPLIVRISWYCKNLRESYNNPTRVELGLPLSSKNGLL